MATNSKRNGPPLSSLTGQGGVWTVAGQLAVRGLHPHFPGVDYGYDLMVDGGIRIQVKSARLTVQKGCHQDTYKFKLWQPQIATNNKTIRPGSQRDYSSVCEFIVLWGINENRFWVVPTAMVSKQCALVLGRDGHYKRSDFAETKALAAMGLTKNEIAGRLGVTTQAVTYQLNGGRYRKPRSTVNAQVKELEGRWDLITGALATLHDANHVFSEQPAALAESVTSGD